MKAKEQKIKSVVKNETIRQAFWRILPTQCVIILSDFIPTTVCLFLAGNLLGSSSVAAVSYEASLFIILMGLKCLASSSTSVVAGKLLGLGDIKNLNSFYSVLWIYAIVIGAAGTVFMLFSGGWLCVVLGMDPSVYQEFQMYFLGRSIICAPYILMSIFLVFLQVFSQQKAIYYFCPIYLVSVLLFGYVFVAVFNLEIFGIGLASSLGVIISAVFLFVWFKRACKGLSFSFASLSVENLKNLLKYGSVVGIGYVFLAIRSIVINYFMQSIGGVIAVASVGVWISVLSVFEIFPIGVSQSVVLIASLFIGSKNKERLKTLFSFLKKNIPIISIIYIVVFVLGAYFVCSLFSEDPEVIMCATQQCLYSIPYELLYAIFSIIVYMYLSLGWVKLATVYNIFLSCLLPVAFMFLFAPLVGVYSVALGASTAIIVSLIGIYCISAIRNRKLFLSISELLWVDYALDNGPIFYKTAKNSTEVLECSKNAGIFLSKCGASHKRSNLISLSCEEVGMDVFTNNCSEKHKKKCVVEYSVTYLDGDILLQIIDNADLFSPLQYQKVVESKDPFFHFGLRTLLRVSPETRYQNVVTLNVFTAEYPKGYDKER